MLKALCQRAFGLASAFVCAQQGSILIYTGAFMAIGVGGAAVSIDIGRIILLRTQMQNRADAGALAGAAQLDAGKDAVDRAVAIATSSMQGWTSAVVADAEIKVKSVRIFRSDTTTYTTIGAEIDTSAPTADDDNAARFIRVDLERIALSFFYGPAASVLAGEEGSTQVTLDGYAIALSDPYICKAQPLMICNPYEATLGKLGDSPGYGMLIKQSGKTGSWGPGNFGLLDLPEDVAYPGANGANAVQAALEAGEPLGCYAVSSLGTAPGNKSGKVKDGVNVRFGMDVTDGSVTPAPNVMNYPHDNIMTEGHPDYVADTTFGDGVWDLAAYWSARHPGVTMPADLSGASRYQIYLFEQGIGYWKKNKKTSMNTSVDEPDATGGWKYLDPAAYPAASVIPESSTEPHNNWVDGIPPTAASGQGSQVVSAKGYERRTLKIAVVNCTANPPSGNATVPSNGEYVEIFITEESGGTDGSATIYGEVIGSLDAMTSLEFHGNVRLIE